MSFEHSYPSFLHAWKAAVEDPEGLIFNKSLYNIMDYILEYDKVKQFEKDLLTSAINVSKIVLDLFTQIDPDSFTRLESLAGQGFGDIHAVKEVLTSLFNSANSDKLIVATRNLIKESDKIPQEDNLILLIFNLVRILLQSYSTIYLKKLPERIFSRAFLSSFEQSIITKVIASVEIQDEITSVWKYLINLVSDGSKSISAESRKVFFEQLFYSNNYWLRDRDYLLRITKKSIKQDGGNKIDVAKEIVRRASINFIREFLGEYYPPGHKMDELHNKKYYDKLSRLVLNEIYNNDNDRRFKGASFQHAFVSSTLSVFLDLLSRDLYNQLPLDGIIGKIEMFIRDNQNANDTLRVNKFDFSLLFFRFIESITEELLTPIINLLPVIQEKTLDTEEFLKLLYTKFVDEISDQSISPIPERITKLQYHTLIDALFDELLTPKTKWKVFFEIGELDLDGKVIETNEVVLYDARVWHMGERFQWDMRDDLLNERGVILRSRFKEYSYGNFRPFGSNELKKIIFKRNSARAMIEILAPDANSAIFEGRRLLKKTLSMIVYEFTNDSRLKYHPEITRSSQAISDEKSLDHYGTNNDPSNILEITEKEKQLLESLQISTQTSFRGDRLYRALAWFNSAFWEEDDYAKYVLYWIGLEQLLDLKSEETQGGTKEKLVRIIPSITITWRNVEHANYVIYNHLREIIRALSAMPQITNKMEDDTKFKNWKRKDFIILENLSLLKEFVNNTSIELSVTMLESWINEKKEVIEKQTKLLRDKTEFETAYLYARRNSLVHEGVTQAGDMEHFMNLLRKLLSKVIAVTLTFPSEQKWDSISKEYNRPFSSFDDDQPQ